MNGFANTIITFAVVPAALVTGSPAFGVAKPVAKTARSETDATLRSAPARTEIAMKAVGSGPDRAERLREKAREYAEFQDGWDGDGSLRPFARSSEAALKFIDQLPGGLPLPGIMVSAAGEIGFYWDLNGGYADISFSESGAGSFFSRTLAGEEEYLADLQVAGLGRDWFFERLGAMAAPKHAAA
jgi:hypothetical protein